MHFSDSKSELLMQISRKHTKKWRCSIILIGIRVTRKQKPNSRKSMKRIRYLAMQPKKRTMISSEMRISQDSAEVLVLVVRIHLVDELLVVLKVLILGIYSLSSEVLVVVADNPRILISISGISSEVWVELKGNLAGILSQSIVKNQKNQIISM